VASRLTVLKLGGSVITDKTKEFTPSTETIARIMKEISTTEDESLIIVHGGGSYGHPLAKLYRLSNGHTNQTQILGFARTRQAMMDLNKIILDSAIENHLPCISVQPSAFIRTRNRRIEDIDLRIVSGLMDLHMIPVMFGDVVLDMQLGFSILSGDQLASRLAIELGAKRMILAADVDGVFDSDPKTNPKAYLMERMTTQDAEALIEREKQDDRGSDVTGRMMGKIKEMLAAVEKGIQVVVLNGCVPGRISNALTGRRTIGTVIER